MRVGIRMSKTIGCPIPGASQPKERMRLIDADELKKRTVKVRFPNAPECGKFDAVVVYEIDIAPTIDPTASIVEQDLLKMGK